MIVRGGKKGALEKGAGRRREGLDPSGGAILEGVKI
jgi:hypothetical protein